MNVERMAALRDHLAEMDPDDFDMSQWHSCIAGQCVKLFGLRSLFPTTRDDCTIAGSYLDLTQGQAFALFMPCHAIDVASEDRVEEMDMDLVYSLIDSVEAARALGVMMRTGNMRWYLDDADKLRAKGVEA